MNMVEIRSMVNMRVDTQSTQSMTLFRARLLNRYVLLTLPGSSNYVYIYIDMILCIYI